jgi:RNA polymerase sigma-70 factor (ECF subfamily)
MAAHDVSVESLIAQAHTDRAALGCLLERYRAFLTVIARQHIGPKLAVRSDASDIVQETMLEAHQAFSRFRGSREPEFSRWIQEIYAHNLAEAVQKHVFAGKRSLDKEQPMVDMNGSASIRMWDPPGKDTSPSQKLIKGETALRFAEVLETLPDMQREAVRLKLLEGRRIDEIAKMLDRSLAATAGLLKRGMAKLRETMSEESWL